MTSDGISVSRDKLYGTYCFLKEPYCQKCSYPHVTTEKCTWHAKDRICRTYALGIYYPYKINKNDLLSKHIRGLKKYANYSVPLGLAMTLCIEDRYPELKKVDVIVPIPKHEDELHTDKESGEKYNQACKLAEIIGKEIDVKIENAINKLEPWSQQNRGYQERINIDALYVHNKRVEVKGKTVLLIDDVRTSGGTGSACAVSLRQAGASKVYLYVAGRDIGSDYR